MLGMREVLVYPHGSKFVIIGGNMRFQACKDLGFTEVPCKVLDKETTAEQLRAITIKDNVGFGEHDWELLANEWDSVELEEWGLEVPTYLADSDIDLDQFFEESNQEDKEQVFKIVLEYTEEDYNSVLDAFKKHSGSKENIIAKLLGV